MLGMLGYEGFYVKTCWFVVAITGTFPTVGIGHDGFDHEFAFDDKRKLYGGDIRG